MYMAPELLADGSASARTDIYSLGVLLYRLLTDRYPFDAHDLDELRDAHAARRRTPLHVVRQDLDPAVADAVDRACDPDPDARFATANEFETVLGTALNRVLIERASVDTAAARAWRTWRRTAAAVMGGILLAGAIGTGLWETPLGRRARRSAGFIVAPRSTLYMVGDSALIIGRGRQLQVVPHNPAGAIVMAVSRQGVRTMTGGPPWTMGGAFDLDGTPRQAPPAGVGGMCCFEDGTTDGEFNYAVRMDSTLLDPIGSRPLAPAAVYRFNRDWSDPQLLFKVGSTGLYYGIGYAPASGTFFLTRVAPGTAFIEEWSRDGRLLATPVQTNAEGFGGVAVDPLDGTLWAVRLTFATLTARLENFDPSGRPLGSFDVRTPAATAPFSIEFEAASR